MSRSEFDGVRFPQEESTGVIMGMGWEQVTFLAVGIGLVAISVITGGFPGGAMLGLVFAVIFGGIGIPRVQGKSFLQWGWVFARQTIRRSQGQNEYLPAHAGDPAFLDGEGQVRIGEYTPVGGPVRRAEDTERDKKGRIKPPVGVRLKLPGEFGETADVPASRRGGIRIRPETTGRNGLRAGADDESLPPGSIC